MTFLPPEDKAKPSTRRTKGKILEPLEQELGDTGTVTVEEDSAGDVVVKNDAEIDSEIVLAKRLDPGKVANLKFMEDMITVHVHETAEKNADVCFEVGVNGRNYLFIRGQTKTVPRFVIETLARAKPINYTNEEYTMPDGERAVRWPSATGLRYGFSVIQDPHPRGGDWLKSVLRQP